MIAFDEADIAEAIGAGGLSRGFKVHSRGQVIDADFNTEGTVITGK
jgi:hypothetical protein